MINNIILLIKASIFWLVFIFFTILLTLPLIFLRIFGYKPAFLVAKLWAFIVIKTLQYICGIKYKIYGNSSIEGTFIFSKHQSTWETIFFLLVIPNPIFIVKRELMYIPFFGWCLYLLKNISIDRASGRSAIKKMILETQKSLEKGFSVILFPEGTRIMSGEKTKIKQGGIVIAKSLKIPIIPITHNAGEFWPKHSFIKYPGTIKILFGKPISIDKKTSEEFKSEIEKWMDQKIS